MPSSDQRKDDLWSPDGPPDASEQAQARSFADLIDQLMTGQTMPPAMSSDERALVDAAAVVRACTREIELPVERRSEIIDDVLSQHAPAPNFGSPSVVSMATGSAATASVTAGSAATASVATGSATTGSAATGSGAAPGPRKRDPSRTDTSDLGERRRSVLVRALPWVVAAASAAAALVLALRHPRDLGEQLHAPPLLAEPSRSPPGGDGLTPLHQSRPSDALIGEIPRRHADSASERIDMIYADRLIGYRDLRLRGGRQ